MKVQHINIMELPEEVLMALSKETPFVASEHGTLTFVARNTSYHGSGYCNELVTFKHGEKFFRFQSTNYLEDEWSFTKPIEVFKMTKQRTDTYFTTWYEDGKEQF